MIDTQAKFVFGFGDGVNGTKTHARRIAAGVSVSCEDAERFVAEFGCFGFAHDEKRDRAVGDLGSVTGGDGAILSIEYRPECGEDLRGLILPWTIVHSNDFGRFSGQVNRANFFGEFFASGQSAGVRFDRESVLKLASDGMLTRENFGGFSHVQSANWVGEAELEADARLKVGRSK